jgi:hypothetical protein
MRFFAAEALLRMTRVCGAVGIRVVPLEAGLGWLGGAGGCGKAAAARLRVAPHSKSSGRGECGVVVIGALVGGCASQVQKAAD